MTDITSYVLASADDATEQGDGTFSAADNSLVALTNASATDAAYYCFGIRVQLNIPYRAEVSAANAYLYWDADTGPDLTIYAHAADNAGDFSTNAHIISTANRPRTTASIPWDDTFSAPIGYKASPDLSAVVQEIVNRPGWVSGNYIVLLFIATVTASVKAVTFTSYDFGPGTQPAYITASYAYDPGYVSQPRVGKKLDFGPININTTLDKTITVSETGTTQLAVSNPALSGADAAKFSVESPSFPFTIADGGASQDITIRCAPTATGHLSATLTMDTNDPSQPTVSYTLLADALDIAGWAIQIDSDRDDTFDNAIDDITDYVLGGSWNNGMAESDQNLAPPARLTMQLNNSSGDFGQDNSGAAYYGKLVRGTLVRILAADPADNQLYQLCKLKVSRLQPKPGAFTSRELTLTCEDPMLDLLDADYRPPLQTNATADAAISTLFERIRVAYPYPAVYWMLGVAGASELEQTTYLLDYEAFINLETGATLFPFIGDNTDQGAGVSPTMLLSDLLAAEDGRLWWDVRTTKMMLHNRHHDYLTSANSGTFTEAHVQTADYRVQEDLLNEVTVQFEPREIGATNSTLWTQPNLPLALKNGEVKTVQAQYSDPNNEYARVGGQDIQPAQAGLDYVANTISDGSGQNVTGGIYVHFQPTGGAAEITLRNPGIGDCYLTTLQLRGTPIVSSGIQSVMARDADSAYLYDYRRKTLTIRMIPTESEANSYAHHKVSRYSTPAPRMAAITIDASDVSALITHGLTRTIGDRIRVTDSYTSHDSYYIIVGESHAFIGAPLVNGISQPRHSVSWVLRAEDAIKGWRLETAGRGELGEQTYLVY